MVSESGLSSLVSSISQLSSFVFSCIDIGVGARFGSVAGSDFSGVTAGATGGGVLCGPEEQATMNISKINEHINNVSLLINFIIISSNSQF